MNNNLDTKYFVKAAVLGLSVVAVPFAYAETIVLKNGSTVKGAIVEMNEVDATIDTADMGRVVVKRRAILSMTDGSEAAGSASSAAPAAPAVPAGLPLVVNNNNNNNNNSAASSSSLVLPPPEKQESIQSTKREAPAASERWSGNIGVGYSLLQARKNAETSQGPAIHIVPLKFRIAAGLSAELIGDGLFHDRQDKLWTKFIHGGIGLGWNSGAVETGSVGSIWSASITYGYAEMTMRHKERFRDYKVSTDKYDGRVAGANMSYSYMDRSGSGLHVGVSGLTGELINKGREKSYDYDYDSEEYQSNHRVTTAYVAYAGYATRF